MKVIVTCFPSNPKLRDTLVARLGRPYSGAYHLAITGNLQLIFNNVDGNLDTSDLYKIEGVYHVKTV